MKTEYIYEHDSWYTVVIDDEHDDEHDDYDIIDDEITSYCNIFEKYMRHLINIIKLNNN